MHLTTLQKRGALTVPQTDRTTLHWTEGQLLLTTVIPPDTLCLRAIPEADTFWPRYTPEGGFPPMDLTMPATTGLWLPASALWHAQVNPDSPWRPIWQAMSRGMTTRRCDPTIVATWSDQMADVFPHLPRPEQARYLQTVCAWPGVDLPDRIFWLTVCDRWGQTGEPWSEVVWALRNAETATT
ncbi:hypothetical protein [Sulfobacillus thermosulfidooxidans]|uniref:hypothetical protein n=1 Tax=Sulfobacillus thermosulfidooxidans TaxID=28034 RepID=UPI00035D185F|nr:hypothetical protein [Sulfobacillus thermosulfidooxidans]